MHPRGRRGCRRACDGLRPASGPQRDRQLRGLTSRRHLTIVPSRIVPRWIASGFLPRSQGRRGAFRRGTERVRTLSPNEAAGEKDLVAPVGTTYLSGYGQPSLISPAAGQQDQLASAPIPALLALISGAGADPPARRERRHQCRASDGGRVRGTLCEPRGHRVVRRRCPLAEGGTRP